MAPDASRTIRSSCLAVTFIARQFGVRINADFVENTLKNGDLSNSKDFTDFFARQGILTKARKTKFSDLEEKGYLFPCVGVMKTGQALILIAAKASEDGKSTHILTIDPVDPTAEVRRYEASEFAEKWAKKIIIVSPKSETASMDRAFDWSWFYPELSRFKGALFFTFIISVLVHALGIAPIIFIQISLDKVLGYEAVGTLYVLTGAVTIALLFLGVLGFVRDYVVNHVTSVIEARLTGDAFDKVLHLPAQMFQVTPPSEMEAKVQSINTIRAFLSRQVLTNIFDATGILVFLPVLIGYSPILALVVVGFSILQGLVDLFSKKQGQALSSGTALANNARNATLRETISGIDTVKTLSQEPVQRRQWRDATAKYIRASGMASKVSTIGININSTLMNLMTVAIIFTGINLVFAGAISAGAIISCNMLGAKVVAPVKGLITFFADLKSIAGAMDRLGSIWNANPERAGLGPQKIISGDFHFKDLSVRFGEKLALEKVNGEVPGRKKIGVVGPSGAGKTTLLRLLQGLIKPSEGIVEIDGNNLASLDLSFYRQQVCLLDNTPTFFSSTIEENIRRARPSISETEFEEVLDISGLNTISKSLPDGLATHLDVTASSLSQSHKLIVAMARGLASAPNLILVDETINNLDKFSQIHFMKNIDRLSVGKTLIMVSNDLRFVPGFDWILVMDKGQIVDQGTHDDLVKNSSLYLELYESEKELSNF
ncbi:MAG: peptidase domain-containing ABC transporter [Gammaproteobacteria bacterium]|nr:peptidase domain-containing ABC transporter [Gammaproteobacteria bacterium]